MVIVKKEKKKKMCLFVDLLNDLMRFFTGLYWIINLTLPIVVYTSESAWLIMALKRNETIYS